MRLFQALRGGREDLHETGAEAAAAAVPEEAQADTYAAASREIGARQEVLSADLAAVAQLAGQLQHLGPLIERVRTPLKAEFDAFRRDHADLVAAKAQIATLLEAVRTLRGSEQVLGGRLKEAGRVSERERGEIESLRAKLEHAVADGARSREALTASTGANEELKAGLAAAETTIRRLQEDAGALRTRVDQGAERRRELDALVARARQDADLAEAENASLRHRVDDMAEHLARVTRLEAQAQAELAADRERASAQLAEAERAHREAQAHAQAFEAQLASARGHGASLATRVEAGAARSQKLESLCVELSTKANDAVTARHAMEASAADGKKALDRALERVEQLERALLEHRSANTALERARLTALERGDQLATALQAQEAALARSEARGQLLEDSLKELADEEESLRSAHEEKTREFGGELRRLETEIELSQAALKAARAHRTFEPVT